MTPIVYRSRDEGRTWEPCEPAPGSVIGSMRLPPGTIWTDGFGNWYRSDPPEEETT